MRQKSRVRIQQGIVDQGALGEPVVARFVVLESERGDVVAQGEQEVVGPVVVGAEQRGPLGDQLAKGRLRFRPDLERGVTVCEQMKAVRDGGVARQVDLSIMSACGDRRVDEFGERDILELNPIATALFHAERAAVLPLGG